VLYRLTCVLQLDSRKNSLEIELNESLRRRRIELQTKIETLGEAENGESSAAEDLDSRIRELKALNSSIQTLMKKSHGQTPQSALVSSALMHWM
jgi:structural maintenance of chromosome 3 (chondroitin sulfate proteoglycan 6)